MKQSLRKLLAVTTLCALALFAFSGCQSKTAAEPTDPASETPSGPVLKVGMELKYPPFETKDTNGNPDGASVYLAKELGKALGRPVEIIDTPYPSLIPALETGQIDIVLSSMTITSERLKKVDFSDPYTSSQLMMLVHKDSKVKTYKDLNKPEVIIASKTGTIGALWATANAPLAQILNIDEEASAVLEVAQGKADVFIYDPLSIIRHHENYKDTTLAILDPLPNTSGWGIAVKKGNDDLREQLNDFIHVAKNNGIYDTIREKYLQKEMDEFEKYDLDFFF